MSLTRLTFTYAGGPQVFSTNFALGVLETDHIFVSVDGNVDGQGNQVFSNFTYDKNTGNVTITDTLTIGDTGTIARVVPIESLITSFEEGGTDVTRRNLDRMAKQVLMSAQQIRDQSDADNQRIDQFLDEVVEDVAELTQDAQDAAASSVQSALAAQGAALDAAESEQAAKDAAQAAEVEVKKIGRHYETRALFVADTGYTPADGTVVTAGGLAYVHSAGATALPGLPGWLPFGRAFVDHFADNVIPGTTDMQAGIVAAVAYCFANGLELGWSAEDYVSTASIPNFHDVAHVGLGRVVRSGVTWRISPSSATTRNIFIASDGDGANDGLSSGQPITAAQAQALLEKYRQSDTRWNLQFARGCYSAISIPSYIARTAQQMLRISGIEPGPRATWGAGLSADGASVQTVRTVHVPINGNVFDVPAGSVALGTQSIPAERHKVCRIEVDASGSLYALWDTSDYPSRRAAILAMTRTPSNAATRALVGFIAVEAGAGGWSAGDMLSTAQSVYYYDIATTHQVFFEGYSSASLNPIRTGRSNFVHTRWLCFIGHEATNTIAATYDLGSQGLVQRCKFWGIQRAAIETNQTLNVSVRESEFGRNGRHIINYSFSQMSVGDGVTSYPESNEFMGATSGGAFYAKNGGHTVGGYNTFIYNGTAVTSDRAGTWDGRGDRYIGNGICFDGENLKYTETIATPDDFDWSSNVSTNDRIFAPGIGGTIYNLMAGSAADAVFRGGRKRITGTTSQTDIASLAIPANFLNEKDVASISGRISVRFTRGPVGSTVMRFQVGAFRNTLSPNFSGDNTAVLEWETFPLAFNEQVTLFCWNVLSPSGFIYPETSGVRSIVTTHNLTDPFSVLLSVAPHDATTVFDVLSSEIRLNLKGA